MHAFSQNSTITSNQRLVNLATASEMIETGHTLAIAGDESLLTKLPKGHWIGGTIPYFMADRGGEMSRNMMFVSDLSELNAKIQIKSYDESILKNIAKETPNNGFSLIILPAGSKVHASYAHNAPEYEDMFMNPIVGWVSGTHLEDIESSTPKAFNGEQGLGLGDSAVVMHLSLPESKAAFLDIINPFEQGVGHSICFPDSGFNVENCLIDGEKHNFAQYLTSNHIDTRLPLVANYSGAMVNVSVKSIDETLGVVDFYAPVFNDVTYKVAMPINDYVKTFSDQMPGASTNWVFSCNCILNYLYMELEGKQMGDSTGPFTFGEIAYQLLNQTMVYLSVENI